MWVLPNFADDEVNVPAPHFSVVDHAVQRKYRHANALQPTTNGCFIYFMLQRLPACTTLRPASVCFHQLPERATELRVPRAALQGRVVDRFFAEFIPRCEHLGLFVYHGDVDNMRSESVVATGSSEASGDLLVHHGVLHVHGDCLLIHSDSTDSDSTDECLNPSIRFSADGSSSRFQVAAPRCIHQRGAASGIDSVAPCGGPPLPCEVSSRASHTAGFESSTVPPVIQR